ncbi:hypothetical protein F5888DRAFT_782908 [Russula emetica]|nr:hypothetical protein F5888DRAFT_782908 [Russula emetica]
MDPRASIIASTFQLADTDSFGDLPVSSPPSETPSPTPGQPTGDSELRRHSIEQLLADFERESSERRSQAPVSPGSLARQSEAETANVWPSQDIENILSGEISVPDVVVEVSGSTSSERGISQEADFAIHYPGYIVEEVKFEAPFLLPDDDFGDTRSVPSPDLAEVAETVQWYDVEEPKTDGRLTEEPDIAIESSRNEDITALQPVVSSVESTATPITSEQHVYPVPPTQRPSQQAPVSDASKAELSSTVPNIPAPIVADPSVPDPVPGDSSTHPPLITDTPDASGVSIIPPAILRVIDLDSSQISSGASGLFTPAQRSEGNTPVQLEDDAAETPTALSNGEDRDLATASIPLQPEDDPLPIERFITGYKDGGGAEDKDAYVDDLIERSQSMPPDERHEGIGTAGVGAQTPAIDTVESADKISLLSGRGSTELSVSQLPKRDSTFAGEVSSRSLPKGSPEHPTVLDPGSGRLLGSPSLAGGDEDADGEADPDYSSVNGAKNHHQTIAHQADDEVTSNKIIEDTLSTKVTASGSESHPTSAPAHRQEPEAVGETSPGSPVDTSAALQDSSTVECGVVQGEGDFATSVQSEVKASDEREHQTRALKRKRRDLNPGSIHKTRSESGVVVTRGKKKGPVSSSRRKNAVSERAAPEWVDPNVDTDSVDDGISETASASSGTSTVYRLLHPTSRTGSVVSSASGDASWTSPPTSGLGRVIPLIHSHGLHRHGPAPPSPASSTDPHRGTRSEQVKSKSPPPTYEPSSPSLRRAPSMNSPVTRSNCRFHKISLPRGEDRVRAYFVVPGCALGDGELMDGEDIRDEGFSTHEDHKRMLPNVETLDLNPYLVGVLRRLVGVDLLREQQEIFYLPSEEEKPKKHRKTTVLGSLRQFRRQSISSGGPLGRDHSPRPSEVSQGRGTPRSASGILSDPDNDDDEGETPSTKRPRFSAAEINTPPASTFTDGDLDLSTAPERSTLLGEEPTLSSKPAAPRRSKRKALKHDAAAYKPSEDDPKDDEEEEETKTRRNSTRKAMKRSRTMEENSASAPRSKKKRLGRSVSVAVADAMDS